MIVLMAISSKINNEFIQGGNMKFTALTLPILALAKLPIDSVQFASKDLSPSQIQQIEQITKDTIANNPALIAEQIENFQAKKIQAEQLLDQQIISKNKFELLSKYNELSFGNPNAKIMIVEFVDYNCSHCKQLLHTVKAATFNDNNVRVIVKELPILGKNSINAAKAVIAASKQGKYLKFENYLLSSKQRFTEDNLLKAAKSLQLNLKQFRQDFASRATQAQIDANFKLAKALFIKATPTLIITDNNVTFGKIIPGALNLKQFQKLIAKAKTSFSRQTA